MINVLIISSYRLICASLSQIIDNVPEFHVVGVAEELADVASVVKEHPVDVIVFEVSSPSVESFDLIKELIAVNSDLKILILSTQTADPLPSQFLQAGAKGFITRQASVSEVTKAIKEVAADRRYLGIDCAQQMALGRMSGDSNPFSTLSAREMQVMMMITAGSKVMSISDQLCLSPKTINTYRYRLFSKLGVDSDVSLTRLAIRRGLMEA